jgi:hypothetical protein
MAEGASVSVVRLHAIFHRADYWELLARPSSVVRHRWCLHVHGIDPPLGAPRNCDDGMADQFVGFRLDAPAPSQASGG